MIVDLAIEHWVKRSWSSRVHGQLKALRLPRGRFFVGKSMPYLAPFSRKITSHRSCEMVLRNLPFPVMAGLWPCFTHKKKLVLLLGLGEIGLIHWKMRTIIIHRFRCVGSSTKKLMAREIIWVCLGIYTVFRPKHLQTMVTAWMVYQWILGDETNKFNFLEIHMAVSWNI